MLKRIQLECRGKKHEEIKELNLDNRRTTGEVEGLTNEFVGLEKLSMNGVGLTTLKGFPALKNLKRLELSDNRISGSLEILRGCPKLSHLNLSGNKIKNIGTLQPLSELQDLNTLDLFNCEVTTEDSYREKMFKLIPHLEYLDGFDRNDQEAVDSEDEDENNVEDINGEVEDDEEDEEDFAEQEEDDDDEVDDTEEDSNLLAPTDNDTDSNQVGNDHQPPVDDDDDGDDEISVQAEESDSEDGEVGLDYLYKDNIQDDDEDNDYNEEDEEEDEDLNEEDVPRGVKRKLEDGEGDSRQSGDA